MTDEEILKLAELWAQHDWACTAHKTHQGKLDVELTQDAILGFAHDVLGWDEPCPCGYADCYVSKVRRGELKA